MLGRAGQPGYDPIGIRTVILKDREELEQVRVRYFQRELNADGYLAPKYADLVSQLNYKRTLEELILLIIGSGIANSFATIKEFLNRTFFAFNFRLGGFESNKLVQYLLINKMDMAYFLELHGNPPASNTYTVQLLKASAEDIHIKITMGDALYYPRISLRDGFLCSCARPPSPFLHGDAHSTFMGKLCVHQTILISDLTQDPTSIIAKLVASLVPLIAGQEYVLDFLRSNGLISVDHGILTISALGRLALSLYLFPDELLWLRDLIANHAFADADYALQKAVQFYALQQGKAFPILKDIVSMWIEEHTTDDILANYPQFGLGDIFTFKQDVTRILRLFTTMANYLQRDTLTTQFRNLEARVEHGVKEELVDLMDYFAPHLTRNRARILFNAGFTNITQITTTDPVVIFKKTKIPLEKIVEMVTLRGQVKSNANFLE